MPRHGPRDRCRRTGKTKFTSYDRAKGAAVRLDGDNIRVYNCPHCGRYHFTGMTDRRGWGDTPKKDDQDGE